MNVTEDREPTAVLKVSHEHILDVTPKSPEMCSLLPHILNAVEHFPVMKLTPMKFIPETLIIYCLNLHPKSSKEHLHITNNESFLYA